MGHVRVALILTGFGIALAAAYWWMLTTGGAPAVDAHYYYFARPAYAHPEFGSANGYNYSPAFELLMVPLRLLPYAMFVALWRAMLLALVVWFAGPATVPVLLLFPVASEVNAGNIQLLLAAAIVAGFRWPTAWAFILLTKVTPGVGLLWFALRREWRSLALALGATTLVVAVMVPINPGAWAAYLTFLTHGSTTPAGPWYLPLAPRLALAVLLVTVGALRGWRWTVAAAATVALPQFYLMSPSMFLGALYLARRELERLREPAEPVAVSAAGRRGGACAWLPQPNPRPGEPRRA